jgi:hypothetical protein
VRTLCIRPGLIKLQLLISTPRIVEFPKLLLRISSFDMVRQLSRSNFHFMLVFHRTPRHLRERLVAGQLGARCAILCRVTVLGLRWFMGIRLCAVAAATHPK